MSDNISFGIFNTFDYNAILLNFQPCLLVVTLYTSPKLQFPQFLKDFADMLSVIQINYNNCVLTGDFNIHVDNLSDIRANKFLELQEYFCFKQHVHIQTHRLDHTLDFVITYGLNINITSVIDIALSDHFFVFFSHNDCSVPNAITCIVKNVL